MFKKIFSLLLAVLLQCFLPPPSAYANSGGIDMQANILYTSENAGGSLLPHFLGSPGFGGKIAMAHSAVNGVDYNVSLNSVQSYLQDRQSSLTGHTGLSVSAGTKAGITYLSARQSYMHVSQESSDFYQDDMYETILKAELLNSTQKPYIFGGLVIPAYVPAEKVLGLSGFGLINHIPVYNGVGWDTGIHVDTYIATSVFNINREQETIVRSRIALQAQTKGDPLEVDLGLNLFQDVQRKKHNIWWDFRFSFQF